MDPILAFTTGVAACLAVGAPCAWYVVRRAKAARPEPNERSHDAERAMDRSALDLYGAQPDGLFAWISEPSAREYCSPKLEDLLKMPRGSVIKFSQIIAAFDDPHADILKRAGDDLHHRGADFDILLPFNDRQLQCVGRRARGASGRRSGDVIWVRDVSALLADATGPASDTETQLRTLFDAMPIPVWLRDPDLELAFSNQAADSESTGVAQRASEIANRALKDGHAHTERRMLDANGERRVVEITEAPLGPGAGTIGFCIEHLGQSGGASTMQRQKEAFSQLLDTLNVAVALYGADRRIESFNSAFTDLWDLDTAWLNEQPSLSLILERLRDTRRLPEVTDFRAFRDAQNGQFETLQAPHEEMMHLPDGRTLKATNAPLAGTGNEAGGLICIFEDITDKLVAQRSYKTLDAVQRHTIDNLQEAVAVFGSDGRMKLYNAPFITLWGLDNDAVDAEPHLSEIVEHMRDPDEDDETWDTRRQGVLATLTQRRNHHERFARANGDVFDVVSVPLPDGAVLISYRDITDEATIQNALQARADTLEETDRLKSKFIADISYEVRTPLTTIKGFSEILGAEYFGELSARQNEYVHGIQSTADTLMTVIADILELAAIESGAAALDKDAVDLHALLAQAMGLVHERARHKDLHISFDVPTDIGWISADERRLKQVVFNLLSNAVRFTPARGGIRLSADRNHDDISITVADTGVGIPQADIERIFQKFAKGDQPDGEPDGAGLGLAMVKSFVELHGGTVDVKSSSNRGTTVVCKLPAAGTEGGDARDAFQH